MPKSQQGRMTIHASPSVAVLFVQRVVVFILEAPVCWWRSAHSWPTAHACRRSYPSGLRDIQIRATSQ
eukprot:4907134-Alexandrium_andersonii.AAC.1